MYVLGTSSGHMSCRRHRYIENTRWVTFDIKFTRQGFGLVCWHREACRAIRHVFSKPSLVNLISKDRREHGILFISLQVGSLFKLAILASLSIDHRRCHSKCATSSWPDKGTCREIGNVRSTCNNAASMRGDWLKEILCVSYINACYTNEKLTLGLDFGFHMPLYQNKDSKCPL